MSWLTIIILTNIINQELSLFHFHAITIEPISVDNVLCFLRFEISEPCCSSGHVGPQWVVSVLTAPVRPHWSRRTPSAFSHLTHTPPTAPSPTQVIYCVLWTCYVTYFLVTDVVLKRLVCSRTSPSPGRRDLPRPQRQDVRGVRSAGCSARQLHAPRRPGRGRRLGGSWCVHLYSSSLCQIMPTTRHKPQSFDIIFLLFDIMCIQTVQIFTLY